MSVRIQEQKNNKSVIVHITGGMRGGVQNPVTKILSDLGVLNNKHIPKDYLTGSRDDRMALLAGILDTDGYLGHSYDIIQESTGLANQIAFLARSMGFAAYVAPSRKECVNNGVWGDYWRVSISGDLSIIPNRVPRRKAAPRKQIKDVLMSGIKVEPVGDGEYFGFEIDGDRLFMLGDFTVTHNTSVAAHYIDKTVNNGGNVFFLAHRKELIEQCSTRLDGAGVAHGIIKAGNKRVNAHPVQVASVQTLIGRVRPKDGDLFGHQYKADLIIIDEAHRALAGTYTEIIKAFPKAKVLGLTATPIRSDGKGLGDLFDSLICCSSTADLMARGYLVKARHIAAPLEPDFAKIKVKMGEFDSKAIETAMNTAKLVGDVYAQWKKHASERITVVFASSRAHGQSILEVFLAAGERAAYLDGDTPEELRTDMLGRLERGELQVVVNMGVLTEGWDCPPVSCISIARPTQSLGLYLQIAGRALRPLPGKPDCLIIDHGGNVMRHMPVDWPREWSLEGEVAPQNRDKVKKCFACGCVHTEYKCPECGHVNKKPKPVIEEELQKYIDETEKVFDIDLEEIDVEKLRNKRNGEISFLKSSLEYWMASNSPTPVMQAKKDFIKKFGRWPQKEIGVFPIWGAGYSGGPPKGLKFQGVVYMEREAMNVR